MTWWVVRTSKTSDSPSFCAERETIASAISAMRRCIARDGLKRQTALDRRAKRKSPPPPETPLRYYHYRYFITSRQPYIVTGRGGFRRWLPEAWLGPRDPA